MERKARDQPTSGKMVERANEKGRVKVNTNICTIIALLEGKETDKMSWGEMSTEETQKHTPANKEELNRLKLNQSR